MGQYTDVVEGVVTGIFITDVTPEEF